VLMNIEDLLKTHLSAICKGHGIMLLAEHVNADTLKNLRLDHLVGSYCVSTHIGSASGCRFVQEQFQSE
jgi:hypothetical protein